MAVGENAANTYPKRLLFQVQVSTICGSVFRCFLRSPLPQLSSQILTISLDLFPNTFKMWRKVVRSGLQRYKVGRRIGSKRALGNVVIWGNRNHFFTKIGSGKAGLRAHRQNPEATGRRLNESTRQLSSQGGRQGSSEDTGRVPRAAKSIRESILYHQSHGRFGKDLPDQCLAGNRGKAL